MDSLSFISDICGALKKLKRTGWVKHQIPLPESDADHMHRCAMCALLLTQPADPRDDYATLSSNAKFHPSRVNTTKLLQMAVTHDLCEALAGDITPFCDPSLVASKHDKEKQAMLAIQKVVGDPLGNELYQLWKEYEEQETVEAIYCKDIDKFEMVTQAFEYEKEYLLSRQEAEVRKRTTSEDAESNEEPSAAKKPKLVGEGDVENNSANETTNNQHKHNDIRQDVYSEPLRGFFISTNSVIQTPLFRRLDGELRQRRQAFLTEKGWNVTEDEQQKPPAALN